MYKLSGLALLEAHIGKKHYYVRKAGGSLLVAYCSLAVACCLLFVSEKWGHNSIHFVVFPVSRAKDSQ